MLSPALNLVGVSAEMLPSDGEGPTHGNNLFYNYFINILLIQHYRE